MTKKVVRRIAICVKYLLIGLITLNFIMFLFIPENKEYIFKNRLQFEDSSGYGHDKLLGKHVDLEVDVMVTSIYNFDYYNGYIYINDKKYILKGKAFIPRSIIGKFYDEIKNIHEFMPMDYTNYYMHIIDFEEFDAKILIGKYYNKGIIRFTIDKDGKTYASYENVENSE